MSYLIQKNLINEWAENIDGMRNFIERSIDNDEANKLLRIPS